MYIINGIAYAGKTANEIEVTDVTALDDMMLLLTFSTNEKRLYDATSLLKYPAFKALENWEIFRSAKTENGVVTWHDGKIDIAPETLYKNSYRYQEPIAL